LITALKVSPAVLIATEGALWGIADPSLPAVGRI